MRENVKLLHDDDDDILLTNSVRLTFQGYQHDAKSGVFL